MKKLKQMLVVLVLITVATFFIFLGVKINDLRYKKFDEPRVRKTVEKVLIEKGLIKEKE